MNPPFSIPFQALDLIENRLRSTSLVELYRLNEEDFIAGAGLLHDVVMRDPDNGSLRNAAKGFDVFCDFLTGLLLGTPTQWNRISVDEKGKAVNFFGKACLSSLPNIRSLQEAYASYGDEKNTPEWKMILQFAGYLTIEGFQKKIGDWDAAAIAAAQARLAELRGGFRELQLVPRRFFGIDPRSVNKN